MATAGPSLRDCFVDSPSAMATISVQAFVTPDISVGLVPADAIWSGLPQEVAQLLLHRRPLRRYDREACRVADSVVRRYPMGSKCPFELPSDAFDSSAGALVPHVGVEADTKYLPGFESMRQHELLAFSIGCGPDRRAGKPGVADLTDVEDVAALPRVIRRPRPSLQIPEARGPNDDAVLLADDGEGHRAPAVPPRQGSVHVAGGLNFVLWDGTPLVEGGGGCRGGHQAFNVAVIERFEANVRAWQQRVFYSHGCKYAMSCPEPAINSSAFGGISPGQIENPWHGFCAMSCRDWITSLQLCPFWKLRFMARNMIHFAQYCKGK